jgi:hypothetical protein
MTKWYIETETEQGNLCMNMVSMISSSLLWIIQVFSRVMLESTPVFADVGAEPNSEDAPAILGVFIAVTIVTLVGIGIWYLVRGAGLEKGCSSWYPHRLKVRRSTKSATYDQLTSHLSRAIGRIDLSQGSFVAGSLPDYEPTPVFKRGSKPPLIGKIVLSTTKDNQQKMDIRFSFSPTEDYRSGALLVTMVLTQIESAPEGVPQIEVIVSVDKTGEASVAAIDKRTTQPIEYELYSPKD